MKKVFSPVVALASVLACANVSAADIILNDFTDGTTQGWNKGGAAGLPLTVETEADGNKYIKLISEGKTSTHPDKKIVFQNETGQWRGNYNAKSAKTLSVRFKNMGTAPVEIHLAFGNTLADLRTRYVVKTGAVIPNDSNWHDASFSLADVQMVPLGGHGKSNASFSLSETLGNVKTIRFSQGTLGSKTDQGHSADGVYTGWNGGPEVAANLWIDDIKLSN
ncbi:MAG: hypothetical protein KAH20_05775 [Methylococcales bacterium]|nr:hypothetical protein [Methylococcales bacterium]